MTSIGWRLLPALLAGIISPAFAGPIAIDIGHSLAHPGTTSARGVPEFEFNQSLAAVLAARLAADGVPTLLINPRGQVEDLPSRPQQAAAVGARLLVSIHHDAVQPGYLSRWISQGRDLAYSDRFAGFSLFVSRRNPHPAESLACASRIGAALRAEGLSPTGHHGEAIPGENREAADAPNGVYYFDDLVVLKAATMPALLVEAGVIVHRDEERALASPARRELTVRAIVRGLGECGVLLPPEAAPQTPVGTTRGSP